MVLFLDLRAAILPAQLRKLCLFDCGGKRDHRVPDTDYAKDDFAAGGDRRDLCGRRLPA
ncbi:MULTISPECIES: hypothetical protein [unclassified Sphingomonas]|uniref:hypothetical protein n=1 Tax=unclassified Sphingomonas TaxID=196159 RepID=UPI000A6FB84B|nr:MULTISPECIES: hypothetical protein [unclassified Sphingomonas]